MTPERLSARLLRMSGACCGPTVTLRELLPGLGRGDHALVTLLVAVCFMHPFPMPGLSVALAAAALVAGARMALGRGVWMPRAFAERPLPARAPGKLFALAARLAARTEGLIRPRAAWLTARPWSGAANGAAIAACGLMLLIPLPPPTNLPPAFALLLLSLGVLESDGVLVALGYLATALSAAFFVAVFALGWAGVSALVAGL